ncbi:MAG: hypothetical protein II728_06020 [Bacteroidaceae bacterium]|nr:hypothetical protein [Bacteroidaceae bacterium]
MNKIVLITGATSGIGLGCARKFAENNGKSIIFILLNSYTDPAVSPMIAPSIII